MKQNYFWNLSNIFAKIWVGHMDPKVSITVIFNKVWKRSLLLGPTLYPTGDTHFEELLSIGNYTFSLKRGNDILFTQGLQNSLIFIFKKKFLRNFSSNAYCTQLKTTPFLNRISPLLNQENHWTHKFKNYDSLERYLMYSTFF